MTLYFSIQQIYLYKDSVPPFAQVLLSKISLLECFEKWILVKLWIKKKKKVALKLINVDLIIKTAVSAPSNFSYISQFRVYLVYLN